MSSKNLEHLCISQVQIGQLWGAWVRMTECIKHDVTSPLIAIRATEEGLEQILPDLMTLYQAVNDSKIELPEHKSDALNKLQNSLIPSMRKNRITILEFLDIVSLYEAKLKPDSQDIKSLSAKSVVENALKSYSFNDEQEKTLIQVDIKHDFQFRCAEIFIENLLDNYLGNAFREINRFGKGEINIWTEEDSNYHTLHFKDTAGGMDEKRFNALFNRFFSKRNEKVVPGLGFCRLAMLQIHADVYCRYVEGEYTEFVLQIAKSNNSLYTSREQLDRLAKSWIRLIDCTLHDIRHPLTLIHFIGFELPKIFPILTKAYELALEHKLEVPPIKVSLLKSLATRLIPGIERNVVQIINFLNLFHPYAVKLISDNQGIKPLSVKSVVEKVLKVYPFSSEEEKVLIHVDIKHDFQFKCTEIFVENLLYSLLFRALTAIVDAGKGEISIWLTEDRGYITLHFKDTAGSMSEISLLMVFDSFFSKKNKDTEIEPDIGFCRLAILQLNGDVICDSVENQYTEFLIKFPIS